MQRILYEISSSNYYPVKFQDIWHVPCIQEKWKYGFCYQKFGYLPNNPAYADKNEKSQFDFLALRVSLFAFSHSEILSSSLLTVSSRDFKFLSAYSKLVSSAKRKNDNLTEDL